MQRVFPVSAVTFFFIIIIIKQNWCLFVNESMQECAGEIIADVASDVSVRRRLRRRWAVVRVSGELLLYSWSLSPSFRPPAAASSV